jgi:pilus assembly protein Flp/PilA
MLKFFRRLSHDTAGATAIEYGLIAAFVALAIVATLPTIKSNLAGVFGGINAELADARKAAKGR